MLDRLTQVATEKAHDWVHWFNAAFTIGSITFDFDFALKVLAFLFVTLPLGIVQWGHAMKFLRERRKNNGGK